MTGPVTCQLWTGEELTGLYPSLLSDCQLVDSEGGDLVVFGGIPECSKPKVTQTAWLNSRESQNKTRNMNVRKKTCREEESAGRILVSLKSQLGYGNMFLF